MATVTNDAITHPGVKIGFHAGSSCCVNLEYLGFLEIAFGLVGSCSSIFVLGGKFQETTITCSFMFFLFFRDTLRSYIRGEEIRNFLSEYFYRGTIVILSYKVFRRLYSTHTTELRNRNQYAINKNEKTIKIQSIIHSHIV